MYKRNFSSVPSGHIKLSSTTPLSLSRDINIVRHEKDAKFWLFKSSDFETRGTIFCLRYFTSPVIFEEHSLEVVCIRYVLHVYFIVEEVSSFLWSAFHSHYAAIYSVKKLGIVWHAFKKTFKYWDISVLLASFILK